MPRGPESEGGGAMSRLTKNYHRLRLPARRTMTSALLELEMLGEEGLGEDEGLGYVHRRRTA